MRRYTIVAVLGLLSGCAVMPADVLLEQDHMSSASQHFRTPATNYGINSTMVYLRWRPTARTYIDLGEGVSYSGALVPSHPETFQGRFGIDIPLQP